MRGALYGYLSNDHTRLDGLLRAAAASPEVMDMEPYGRFRAGLLRHISIEEKIVIPAILSGTGGQHTGLAARLRLDHGALVSLLVPTPSRAIVETIRTILSAHNPLEEDHGGLYDILERVAAPDKETMLARLQNAPDVPVLPHNDKPGALEATRRAVARAGYELKSNL